MINSLQRFLYVLGTVSPFSLIASICFGFRVSYAHFQEWVMAQPLDEMIFSAERIRLIIFGIPAAAWILSAMSVILIGYHLLFLRIALKRLAPMTFSPESTPEENDAFAQGLGVAYFFPIAEWVITENIFASDERMSGILLLAVGAGAILVSLIANKSHGSPIYLLAGYHFHTVETEDSKPYVLMSKKKNYRNKNQVKKVVRLFEDLLIDVTE